MKSNATTAGAVPEWQMHLSPSAIRARILHQDDLVQALEHGVRRELRLQLVSERLLVHVAVSKQELILPTRHELHPLAVNVRPRRQGRLPLPCGASRPSVRRERMTQSVPS